MTDDICLITSSDLNALREASVLDELNHDPLLKGTEVIVRTLHMHIIIITFVLSGSPFGII